MGLFFDQCHSLNSFHSHEVLRNAHEASKTTRSTHAHSHLAQPAKSLAHAAHPPIACAAIIPAAGPRRIPHQKARQPDAELPREAGKYTAADERHDDEDEDLDGVAAEVVPQLAEEVLELGDQAGDVAVARAPLVVRGAAGAVAAVRRVRVPTTGAVGAAVGRAATVGGEAEPGGHCCGVSQFRWVGEYGGRSAGVNAGRRTDRDAIELQLRREGQGDSNCQRRRWLERV